MTAPLSNHIPADEEAAALWAARLDGDKLSPATLREFEAWLAGHPARRELVAEYCQFAIDLGQLLPALAATGKVALPPASPVATSPHHRWLFPSLALGGLAAAVAAVALVLWAGHAPSATAPERQYVTTAAQRHSLTLADGTHIDLSARTRVTIALGSNERRVQLAAGQAFFDVAKDAGKPFTVETPVGSVLVTGTRFAVRADAATGLEVIVAEGQVRVSPSAGVAPVSIGANQHLTAKDAQVSVEALAPEALSDSLAWRNGQIVFSATPVGQALASFARYHGREISASAEASALRVGGRYNLDDLDGFLAALEEILPVTVTHSPDGPVQVGLRGNK
jgi:transmembrane sensor